MSIPTLSLYNTLTRQVEPFEPMVPGCIKMYVCGPTVYDSAHLGHARCYITWDVVYRFFRFLGYQVTYVRNVTDVDDKILNKAREKGQTPQEVAAENYASFKADMASLNTLDPTHEPKATEYITSMVSGIGRLIDSGVAYSISDGTVYYRTPSKRDYGKLSKKPLEDLQSGIRVEVDPDKESPLDFALWKGVSPEDFNAWPAPWGRGRPGWHMECSTMIQDILGDQIDLHAGGMDLIFPHHENEIAQSEALSGKTPFVKYWVHNGFVNVDGEKMSKSLGNFSTIQGMLTHFDANTLRYFLLTHHYRVGVDFTPEALTSAQNRMIKIHRLLHTAVTATGLTKNELQNWVNQYQTSNPLEDARLKTDLFQEFLTSMLADFNTAKALAALNTMLGQLSKSHPDPASAQNQLFETLTVFCLLGFKLDLIFEAENASEDKLSQHQSTLQTLYQTHAGTQADPTWDMGSLMNHLLAHRSELKLQKQWAEADAIRNELQAIGITLKDSKEGPTTWE